MLWIFRILDLCVVFYLKILSSSLPVAIAGALRFGRPPNRVYEASVPIREAVTAAGAGVEKGLSLKTWKNFRPEHIPGPGRWRHNGAHRCYC